MIDKSSDALKALTTYDWGVDPKVLSPIDERINATHGDAKARGELEGMLVAVLKSGVPRAARDVICRKLRIIGTAACVGALADLLRDKEDSHMARYALERIPVPEAAKALRDSIADLAGEQKIGVIGSLGVRQDEESVGTLASLLGDRDEKIAKAAACALGAIRSASAAKALSAAKPAGNDVRMAATDASLACAEGLLADGKKMDALKIYKGLAGQNQPKHVRLAATRGMLACAGKSS